MAPPILFDHTSALRTEVEFKSDRNYCLVILAEELDERTEFNQIQTAILKALPPPKGQADGDGGRICFDFSRNLRINSQGFRGWLTFLQGLTPFYQIEFGCVSEPVLEMAALWPGILGDRPVKVSNVAVPYICRSCSYDATLTMEFAKIGFAGTGVVIPKQPCPRCKKEMEADVLDDYLAPLAP